MQRVILHVDMDAFFVEVERLSDPSLIGKPVIVGGDPDGRGVVCSASYEARAFGVRSAMPMSRARRLCPQAAFVRVGTSDYGHYSRQVTKALDAFSPLVEMRSIDEAYVDLTGSERLHGPPAIAAEKLRQHVMAETGLPASCGVAANKLVAKVASDLAKPQGLLLVQPGEERQFLAPLPMRRLPGIGARLAEKLERYGLETLGDIQQLGADALCGALGDRAGLELHNRVRGLDDSPVIAARETKSVSRETTFHEDTGHWPTLESTLSQLSERVARGLRKIHCRGRTITLKVRYSDFQTVTRSLTLPEATDDDRAMFNAAREKLRSILQRRVRVRLLGVGASNLTDAQWQLDFLEQKQQEKDQRLLKAIDEIKDRYGSPSIMRALSWSSKGDREKKDS
jgi:DNA polymerase-4